MKGLYGDRVAQRPHVVVIGAGFGGLRVVKGLRRAPVDVTVVAARPRLGARLDEMRDAIASLLDLPPEAVNVKASTGNLSGDDGAGRSISAHAVATVGSAT